MGEGPEETRRAGGSGGRWLALALVVVLVLGAGALYFSNREEFKAAVPAPPSAGELQAYAKGSLRKLEAPARASRLTDLKFNDAEGRPADLSAFRGRIVVLNLWATWCAPCVTEMPTLAALQRAYPVERLTVVPVSMDPPRLLPNAKNFIDVHDPLPLYHDPNFAMPTALGVKGMPATVIYDREGREVARLMGEADWDSPEARALLDRLLAE